MFGKGSFEFCFQVPIHSSGTDVDQNTAEVRQLRETVASLTAQCAQLDEANCAWQLYQQTQTDNLRTKLRDYLVIDDNVSFDAAIDQIVEQIAKDREDFSDKYAELEKLNDDLRSGSLL